RLEGSKPLALGRSCWLGVMSSPRLRTRPASGPEEVERPPDAMLEAARGGRIVVAGARHPASPPDWRGRRCRGARWGGGGGGGGSRIGGSGWGGRVKGWRPVRLFGAEWVPPLARRGFPFSRRAGDEGSRACWPVEMAGSE